MCPGLPGSQSFRAPSRTVSVDRAGRSTPACALSCRYFPETVNFPVLAASYQTIESTFWTVKGICTNMGCRKTPYTIISRNPVQRQDRGSRPGASPAKARVSVAAGNCRRLLISVLPVLLVGMACLSSYGLKIVRAEKMHGQMTRSEAEYAARQALQRLTGARVQSAEVTATGAFSVGQRRATRTWDAVCRTAQGPYLIRINADSRRLYAVNYLGALSGEAGPSAGRASGALPSLTRAEGEQRAKQLLEVAGVSAKALQATRAQESVLGAPRWCFTFQRAASTGGNARLVKVALNSRTGALQHLWNPVNAL